VPKKLLFRVYRACDLFLNQGAGRGIRAPITDVPSHLA
jgi:hypothetical protein